MRYLVLFIVALFFVFVARQGIIDGKAQQLERKQLADKRYALYVKCTENLTASQCEDIFYKKK